MGLKKLIRNFVFKDDIRNDLIFSDPDKIRLEPESQVAPTRGIILNNRVTGEYPTDDDIYIETPFLEPNALKQWLKFEARVDEDEFAQRGVPDGTSIGFKIKTTGGNMWWNGTMWEMAGASDWNTEQEINDHISTLPIASIGNKKIGFVLNLKTTNPTLTPEVKELKLLGQFDIEFLDDIIYDGIIRKLNSEFRTSSIVAFHSGSSPLSSVDLNSILENKAYNISGIRSVYNITDDPMKLTNLFSGYSTGAPRKDGFTYDPGIVTFNTSIPADKVVEVVFEYLPEIMVVQDQDFYEVKTFPSIVFESIISTDQTGFINRPQNSIGEDYIRDKANLTAYQQQSPRQTTLRFAYAVLTNSQMDQTRIANDLNEFWSNNSEVRTYGLDNKYGISISQELQTTKNQRVDGSDTQTSEGTFEVLGVLFYDREASPVPLVGSVNIDYSV